MIQKNDLLNKIIHNWNINTYYYKLSRENALLTDALANFGYPIEDTVLVED